MNFEEGLERLKERHEALAQSLELFVISSRENFDRTDALIRANRESISELVEASAALLHTAESHERRINGLEGGRA